MAPRPTSWASGGDLGPRCWPAPPVHAVQNHLEPVDGAGRAESLSKARLAAQGPPAARQCRLAGGFSPDRSPPNRRREGRAGAGGEKPACAFFPAQSGGDVSQRSRRRSSSTANDKLPPPCSASPPARRAAATPHLPAPIRSTEDRQRLLGTALRRQGESRPTSRPSCGLRRKATIVTCLQSVASRFATRRRPRTLEGIAGTSPRPHGGGERGYRRSDRRAWRGPVVFLFFLCRWLRRHRRGLPGGRDYGLRQRPGLWPDERLCGPAAGPGAKGGCWDAVGPAAERERRRRGIVEPPARGRRGVRQTYAKGTGLSAQRPNRYWVDVAQHPPDNAERF